MTSHINQYDPVNRPSHYIGTNGLECKDIVRKLVFDFVGYDASSYAQAIQYILRAPRKNGIEDLKKARFYIEEVLKSKDCMSDGECLYLRRYSDERDTCISIPARAGIIARLVGDAYDGFKKDSDSEYNYYFKNIVAEMFVFSVFHRMDSLQSMKNNIEMLISYCEGGTK